jgi:hypothetical protein
MSIPRLRFLFVVISTLNITTILCVWFWTGVNKPGKEVGNRTRDSGTRIVDSYLLEREQAGVGRLHHETGRRDESTEKKLDL